MEDGTGPNVEIGIRTDDREDAFGGKIRGGWTPEGEWHHLVLSRSDGYYTFFVNGSRVRSRLEEPRRVWRRVTIGGTRDGTRDWHGEIDELSVFRCALSSAQVKALYADAGLATRLVLDVGTTPNVPP